MEEREPFSLTISTHMSYDECLKKILFASWTKMEERCL